MAVKSAIPGFYEPRNIILTTWNTKHSLNTKLLEAGEEIGTNRYFGHFAGIEIERMKKVSRWRYILICGRCEESSERIGGENSGLNREKLMVDIEILEAVHPHQLNPDIAMLNTCN